MTRGDDIVLLSHCLGSIIAHDALWQLAHADAADWYEGQKIALWMTFGSPLGDEMVKSRLAGTDRPDQTRYPNNVVRWVNVTADWLPWTYRATLERLQRGAAEAA